MGRVSPPEKFPRAAKLVLTSTGAYLGFPVGPAGWCSQRSVEGCFQPLPRGGGLCSPPPSEHPSLNWAGPVGMKWEVQGCSEEGKTRAGWHFWSTLESSGMGVWNSSPWSVPTTTGLRDPGGFWVFPVRPWTPAERGWLGSTFIGTSSHIKGGQHPHTDASVKVEFVPHTISPQI